MWSWNQFKNLPRISVLSISEQNRQFFIYQSDMIYENNMNILSNQGSFVDSSDGVTPVNTVPPVISGDALVGNTLSTTSGTWTSDTGINSYLYQWTRDGVDIDSATSTTYTLVEEDRLKTIICKVAATDSNGTSVYINSNSLFEGTVNAFKLRVLADGGTFESESFLITQIENLL